MNLKSPFVRLLGSLPADIAEKKRKDIERELTEAGEWEHYRQSVRRPGYDLRNTHIGCAVVLKKHLGITDTFFIGNEAEQDRQINQITKKVYEKHLA